MVAASCLALPLAVAPIPYVPPAARPRLGLQPYAPPAAPPSSPPSRSPRRARHSLHLALLARPLTRPSRPACMSGGSGLATATGGVTGRLGVAAPAHGPLVVALLRADPRGHRRASRSSSPHREAAGSRLRHHAPLQGQHPSVVYITNLVVHMADCLVQCYAYGSPSTPWLAVRYLGDGVLHKVEAASGTLSSNIEEYGSVVARAITSGDENVAKGILWHGVMTVDMLPQEQVLEKRIQIGDTKAEVSPEMLGRIKW
ncbi:hypothetical protein ZWY2020_054743 [Hordeum vulgare]|nr:hypothetical protein ZWY2020_054743 [Hordeum vulgare]